MTSLLRWMMTGGRGGKLIVLMNLDPRLKIPSPSGLSVLVFAVISSNQLSTSQVQEGNVILYRSAIVLNSQ